MSVKDLLGFTFKGFYHPYADLVLQTLNERGFFALFNQLQREDDENEPVFDKAYRPNKEAPPNSLFQVPSPREKFTFNIQEPYAKENWMTYYHIIILLIETLLDNNKPLDAIAWIEACLYDPKSTSPPDPENPTAHYWKLPIFKQPVQSTIDFFNSVGSKDLQDLVQQLNHDPYNPFLVAYKTPQSFMRHVVHRMQKPTSMSVTSIFEWHIPAVE